MIFEFSAASFHWEMMYAINPCPSPQLHLKAGVEGLGIPWFVGSAPRLDLHTKAEDGRGWGLSIELAISQCAL